MQGGPLRRGRRRADVFTLPGRTPPPRDIEGAHPGRNSHARNVETPTESARTHGGGPTVRKAEVSGGIGRLKKRMPVGRKARGNRGGIGGASSPRIPANPPDTGLVPGSERTQTWAG